MAQRYYRRAAAAWLRNVRIPGVSAAPGGCRAPARARAGGPHCGADSAAGNPMVDPESADVFSGVGQRESIIGVLVRKECWVEIEPDLSVDGPINPILEVRWLQLIAFNPLPTRLRVAGVQVHPMIAGDQAQCTFKVTTELVRSASPPGVVAGHRESAP